MSQPTPNILIDRAYIGGEWRDSEHRFAVTDPATGECLAQVPDLGAGEAHDAIAAAEAAWPQWRRRPAKERASLLRAWFERVMAHREALAQLMTLEQGKPLAESRGEVAYGASFIEYYAEEAKRIAGETLPSHGADKRILVMREPIGVVAAITPWNFPLAMITRKCAPALAAGCPVVIKPAEATPLTALALAKLAEDAGLPAGVVNVLTAEKPAEIGEVLTTDPRVRKVSFTGSTAVGKRLLTQCAETVKKASMELGGNAPFVVFDDADLDAAVEGAIASKFRNSGQTCVCTNRFLVQDGVYDEFIAKFAARIEALQVGNGLDEDVTLGPLINASALEKVEAHIADARSKGARLVCGGKPHALGGTFFQPTLLADVTDDMHVAREETFGPVAPVFRFTDEAQAIAMANATEFGLAAYVYARDYRRIWQVMEGLEYGMVAINEGLLSTELAPFGGIKESGLGREGSHHGLEEYTELKYVCMGGL
ncbi:MULTISPECIES: NAD-dependent succinate-semialdehyde dehydrogenase [unclassified Chromohalobacter]|uniref:NAD-dependent succinate-semialdehyde dehydrogenase n=1 Tax=unclassified Chromohalobacter TaxID=2628571 RepID=UPI002468773E|nr:MULTISPECIES: NAD-dependent succinate-semialdehyde dehydrogenase [unclassified Chromohalobacter]